MTYYYLKIFWCFIVLNFIAVCQISCQITGVHRIEFQPEDKFIFKKLLDDSNDKFSINDFVFSTQSKHLSLLLCHAGDGLENLKLSLADQSYPLNFHPKIKNRCLIVDFDTRQFLDPTDTNAHYTIVTFNQKLRPGI